jgi:phage-related baseplate assembly protein
METNPLELIPDIDFVPLSAGELMAGMVSEYEQTYRELTGKKITLPPSSETRIFLYTQALRIHQILQYIDFSAKQNLLKYSSGAYLDNLAAMLGLERLPAQKSVASVMFALSAARPGNILIPAGTRASGGDNIYFATVQNLIIPFGKISGSVGAVSLEAGARTAGIAAGRINVLVDPVPFVASVENTQPSQGGADAESDESLRLRCYYYPRSYSVAGPVEAYEYYISLYSQAIEGCKVSSPAPGAVDIRITLTGGELPAQAFNDALLSHLKQYIPLTDNISISAPDAVDYTLEFTYYAARSDAARLLQIQDAVNAAARNYVAWQGAAIGRDINPDELRMLVKQAGAKRLDVFSPAFSVMPDSSIAQNMRIIINFGGIEDD